VSQTTAPPITDPIIEGLDQSTLALSWILFFTNMFNGDSGTAWSPIFTSLAVTGSPKITGRYYKITKSLVYFSIRIEPSSGGDSTSTAGTTRVTNFPLTFTQDGACLAVSGNVGGNAGMVEAISNLIYVPAWSAVTVPLTIVGLAEVKNVQS
jgi:hypothetical protein